MEHVVLFGLNFWHQSSQADMFWNEKLALNEIVLDVI
jgi:hypothetical protein